MNKKKLVLLVIFFVILGAHVWIGVVRQNSVRIKNLMLFEKLSPGMSAQEIKNIVGKPDIMFATSDSLWSFYELEDGTSIVIKTPHKDKMFYVEHIYEIIKHDGLIKKEAFGRT